MSNWSNVTEWQTSIEISRFIGFYLLPPVCLIGFFLNVVSVVVLKSKSFVGVPYSFMAVIATADAATLLVTSFIAYARCNSNCPLRSVLLLYYDSYVYLPVSNIVEGISSLLTMSLAIERYLSMVKYFWVRQYSTRCNVYGYIGAITLLSTVLGLPYAFIWWVDVSGKKQPTRLFHSSVYMVMNFVRPCVMVVAPLLLLVIFNSLLIRVTFIQRSRRNVRLHKPSQAANVNANMLRRGSVEKLEVESDANSHSVRGSSSVNAHSETGTKGERRSARDKAEHRLTVMSICIILLFVVGHTPVTFAYAIIWSTFGGDVASLAHVAYTRFAQLLLVISLSSNFFMYLHFNKHFRAALTCSLAAKHSGSNHTQHLHTQL